MSTRSRIALKRDDNRYESIYCHFDGDDRPGGVGDVLRKHHTELAAVEALIALGDLSYLSDDEANAYHRDQGCHWCRCRPESSKDYVSLLEAAKRSDADYLYLFSNGEWEVIRP